MNNDFIWDLLTNAVAKVALREKLSARENFALNLAGTDRSLMGADTEAKFVQHIKTNMKNPNFEYNTPKKFFFSVRSMSI